MTGAREKMATGLQKASVDTQQQTMDDGSAADERASAGRQLSLRAVVVRNSPTAVVMLLDISFVCRERLICVSLDECTYNERRMSASMNVQ